MAKYFLIESRSPFDSVEVNHNYELASDLAQAGHEVTLFLVENGVFVARSQVSVASLEPLEKVTLLADEFSLRERGIDTSEVKNIIKLSDIGVVVDAMTEGQKVMWL
jgi:predicted peroxiredoxin